MLSKWPWISRCGDYWQQAELRTDGACRIMMMMMTNIPTNFRFSKSCLQVRKPYRADGLDGQDT